MKTRNCRWTFKVAISDAHQLELENERAKAMLEIATQLKPTERKLLILRKSYHPFKNIHPGDDN